MDNYRHDTQQCPLPNSRYCWIRALSRVTKEVIVSRKGNIHENKMLEWLNMKQIKV